MGIGSITMGILAFLCMLGGIVLSFVPFLGAMLSFLSPVLALIGIILGGVAMSRAREGGESESLALGGLITSIIAFVPSMLVAVTCGLCNTCWTGVILTPHDAGPPGAIFPDAGHPTWPGAPPPTSYPPPPTTPPPPGSWAPPPTGVPTLPAPVPGTPGAPVPPAGSGGTPIGPGTAVDPSAPAAVPDPALPGVGVDPSAPTHENATGTTAPTLPPPPLPPGPNVRHAP